MFIPYQLNNNMQFINKSKLIKTFSNFPVVRSQSYEYMCYIPARKVQKYHVALKCDRVEQSIVKK